MKKLLSSILSVFLIVAMLSGTLGMLSVTTDAYSYIEYGIDVSAWQGSIDWTSVKAAGIDFAILRIMASGKDRYFETNYVNAKAAGVKLGVYIYSYADTVAEAQTEAATVLGYLDGRTLEYPVYYDIEDPTVHAVLTNEERNNLCYAFCDVIEANGYRAGIYSSSSWFNSKLDRAALTAKYEIWEASWPTSDGTQVKEPIYDKSSTCGMWQYTSEGSVSGISGYVDLNVSYKDYESYMMANGLNGYGSSTGATTKNGYYQTTASVNFRTGPSTSYSIISTLASGTQVAVTGFNSDSTWAHVLYNDSEGWISMSYLTYVRAFKYNMNYITNNSTTIDPGSFRYGSIITVPTPTADSEDVVFYGWQLLRYSDFLWYDGSSWVADQKSSKYFAPGEVITFEDGMFNSLAGDDEFYLGAVWKNPYTDVTLVTPTDTTPSGYGWKWSSSEAYGVFQGYGTNGQDIEFSVDMALLESTEVSTAVFYDTDHNRAMTITPTSVTVGTSTVSYDWGETSIDNWHNVKFKILNGMGYLFIDGELITYDSNITALTSYQMLFSQYGEMAIDNVIMMSSDGTTYFSCDYENASSSTSFMTESLGERVLLFTNTDAFELAISATGSNIVGTGSITLTATPSAGEGHTYVWSSSSSALNSYMTANGNTLTINIPAELSSAINATITCTATSNGAVTASASTAVTYSLYPTPTISSVAPQSATITDTGSASFTVAASGDGLTYKWTCSDSRLAAYISGADTKTVTVTVPEALAEAFTATLTCTVTNTYSKTAVSSPVSLVYELSEDERLPGDLNGDGKLTSSDFNIARRIVVGLVVPEAGSEDFIAADLNGDGAINSKDINALMKLLV